MLLNLFDFLKKTALAGNKSCTKWIGTEKIEVLLSHRRAQLHRSLERRKYFYQCLLLPTKNNLFIHN
jgi:hypothetical protein